MTLGLLMALGLSACGAAASTTTPTALGSLRLGYLTNLTHAGALVGLKQGLLAAQLPGGTKLSTQAFNAGPAEVEALLGGALDAAFVGPSPAVNAFVKSKGSAIRIVAGATSGGAGLVVRSDLGLHDAGGLKGLKIATPQLGNTQDVALRSYLAAHGLTTDPQGGGDVHVVPTDNATALQLFKQGQIAGAWEPEPWESRMVIEGKGRLLVDETSLWPQGRFPTTELVVSQKLLRDHRDVVEGLIRGQITTTDWIVQHPAQARSLAGAALAAATGGKPLADSVLVAAWAHLDFTVDPLAVAFKTEAAHAQQVGLLSNTNLQGIIDVTPLNDVLKAAGRSPVDAAGLAPR